MRFSSRVIENLLKWINLCVCDKELGNSLSPVCSNLYMEFFERNILTTILPNHVKWFLYEDDVFLWPKLTNLQSFLYDLNNLVPWIEFSKQIEKLNCLLFLDMLIRKNKMTFCSMFTYIHLYSNHSINARIANFCGF